MSESGKARAYELNYREKIVEWVWERMGAAHGERWARVYGPVWDAKRERQRKRNPRLWPRLARTARIWADRLAPLQKEAITRAVEACEKRQELPTLPEFLALCRGVDGCVESRVEVVAVESEQERAERIRRGKSMLEGVRSMLAADETVRGEKRP